MALAAGACLANSALPSAAGASKDLAIRGPATVRIGSVARFRAIGFRAGSYLSVVLTPADRPTCCAYRVPPIYAVGDDGQAHLTFQFPTYYIQCSGYGASVCRRQQWKPNERAILHVSGYLQNTTASVRLEK
jgi:hypothetical protein